ncbi:MAG: DHH family phosphoesterase [Bacteroidetes bacterium]|nr:DHH family phosphoesterase [Bacteroidota bacterium]
MRRTLLAEVAVNGGYKRNLLVLIATSVDAMLKDILEVLLGHHCFVITTHQRPDGDAIGSQVALGRFLEHLGKEVVLFNSDPVPPSLEWMPGSEVIRTGNTLENLNAVAQADLFVVVDTNSRDRLGKTVDRALDLYKGPVLLVDHHTEPESWFTWMMRDEDAAATGELIYDLICTYDRDLIDSNMATALYTALMTDTGSFRFSSVTPKVHRMAADLLDRGSYSPLEVYAGVYENHSPAWPRLVSMAFQGLTFLYDGELAYITITRHMLETAGVGYDEIHGFSDMVMSIAGVRITLIFTETKRGVKVSFRSKGSHRMDIWAQIYGGGGHHNAAGAFIRRPVREAVEVVLEGISGLFEEDAVVLAEEDEAYLKALSSPKQ